MKADTPRTSTVSLLPMVLAAIWVVGFSVYFFSLDLPNNTQDPSQPLTRTDVWRVLFVEATTVFHPLDYSVPDGEAGWSHLSERRLFLGVAALLMGCAWLCGAAALKVLSVPCCGLRSERIVLCCGTGLSLLSLWTLLIGLAGMMSVAAFLTLPVVAAITVAISRFTTNRTTVCSIAPAGLPTDRLSRGWTIVLCLILVACGLHLMLGGMTPPRDFDVREYHLQGPKEWFETGRITQLEHNVYTSFPFLSEMLSLAAMILTGDWWQGAMAGKLTLACFQILTTVCVYAIARRWAGPGCGLIAAVACLSTPWVLRISLIAYAEGAISFYLAATVMTALLVNQIPSAVDRRRMVAVTGFLAGSAMASKYPGLVSVVIPVSLYFVVLYGRRPTPSQPFGIAPSGWESSASAASGSAAQAVVRSRPTEFALAAGVFVAGITLAAGPWLARNLHDTGNPVYPLGYSVFGADDWSSQMDAKWRRAHSPDDHDVSRLPLHLRDVAARSDWQSGLLFALAVPAVLLVGRNRQARWLWLAVLWTLSTWWALTHRIDRFWVPVIPILAVLAGMAWRLSRQTAWRGVVLTALLIHCTYNYGFGRLPLVGFHGGLRPLSELRQLPVRTDIRQLNQLMTDSDRVLLVGEAEVFDARFRLVYNTVFDDSIFQQWTSADLAAEDGVQPMKPADDVATVLRQNGITCVLVNWSEVLRYRLTYGFTAYVQPEKFTQLVDAGVLLPPTVLLGREAAGLSADEKRELERWPGFPDLLNGDLLKTVVLYRVAGDGP